LAAALALFSASPASWRIDAGCFVDGRIMGDSCARKIFLGAIDPSPPGEKEGSPKQGGHRHGSPHPDLFMQERPVSEVSGT
jgi:hypothetical protein